MEAKELRIGNFICREDLGDSHERFETIIELSDRVKTTGPLNVICDYDEIKPIPLTEEWFLKFGFDYQFEILNFPNNDIFGFKATSKRFELITYNSEDTTETGVIIKHVHQLQNLYFALTGEELQISSTFQKLSEIVRDSKLPSEL